jgi:hypothetical protein
LKFRKQCHLLRREAQPGTNPIIADVLHVPEEARGVSGGADLDKLLFQVAYFGAEPS